jgi:hypothetical protein
MPCRPWQQRVGTCLVPISCVSGSEMLTAWQAMHEILLTAAAGEERLWRCKHSQAAGQVAFSTVVHACEASSSLCAWQHTSQTLNSAV